MRRYICRWLRLPRDTKFDILQASTHGITLPILAFTIPMLTCQWMVKISNGDDFVVCLGNQSNIDCSEPPSIDGIRSSAKIRSSLNKQLYRVLMGRFLNLITCWIVELDVIVINAHNYINVLKLWHNILPCPARLRCAYPQLNNMCNFCGYPNSTCPTYCPQTHDSRVSHHEPYILTWTGPLKLLYLVVKA